jgi:hypothetical protein
MYESARLESAQQFSDEKKDDVKAKNLKVP